MFKDKKKVKFIAMTIAVLFLLGVVGLALSQSSPSVAMAAASSNIGVINNQEIMASISQSQEVKDYQQAMQAEYDKTKKRFEEESATMNEAKKRDYYQQLQQLLQQKDQEMSAPILNKINAAIKAVSDAKGFTAVFDKSIVVYGGTDITQDVINKLKAN